ncbi:hypothetical protein EDC96DRAFT_569262 [Choanephora cucurbitarum]|nr:hypothetical protein EDC96DRAFT_569262 [Choanephora cucurbitarum]
MYSIRKMKVFSRVIETSKNKIRKRATKKISLRKRLFIEKYLREAQREHKRHAVALSIISPSNSPPSSPPSFPPSPPSSPGLSVSRINFRSPKRKRVDLDETRTSKRIIAMTIATGIPPTPAFSVLKKRKREERKEEDDQIKRSKQL